MKSSYILLSTFSLLYFSADLHNQDTTVAKGRRDSLRDRPDDLAANQQHMTSYGWLFV